MKTRTKKIILYSTVTVIVALNLADLATTFWVLDHGGIEGNPAVAILIDHSLLIPVKLGVLAMIIGLNWLRRTVPVTWARIWVGVLVAAIYLCVVAWNVSRIVMYSSM